MPILALAALFYQQMPVLVSFQIVSFLKAGTIYYSFSPSNIVPIYIVTFYSEILTSENSLTLE